jgi:tetratricopeptide (TPR) repeat protein
MTLEEKPMFDIYFQQGNHEFKHGKYRAALNSYSKAIALQPQSIEAHYACGLAAEKLGKHKLAQDFYTTVVKLKTRADSDSAILLKPPTTETTQSEKYDNSASPKNSVFGGITLCFFLMNFVLQIVASINYIVDRPSFHSQPQIDSNAIESVSDLRK